MYFRRIPITPVLLAAIVITLVAPSMSMAYSAPDKPLIPDYSPTPPMSTVAQYGKFEAAFTLSGQSGNPFDPDVNKVDVVFHGPSASIIDVPAFWDGDVWKVRFAPKKPGRYTLAVLYNDSPAHPRGLTSKAFTCTPSRSPGYIHLDPTDIQRFVFDNGTGYYPIGLNQAWTAKGSPEYPDMFAKMHDCHLNYARIWMTFWDDKALDWAAKREDNPKIGYYSLPAARRMDMLMDSAAKNGVYIQLCLQHHGQYTMTTDSNWSDNPANAANGGYLKNPADFFTDGTARRLTRAKYRYIVARWGYSTHLLSYELFNEVQNIREIRGNMAAVGAWHKEMAAAIRAVDYAHHPITSSWADDTLRNAGLDYDQWHIYSSDIRGSLAAGGGNRPVFVGEFGPGGGNWGYDEMKPEVLHDGLWSGMTAATAGAPEFWYWDIVAAKDWWPTLKSAALFYELTGAASKRHLEAVHAHFASPGGVLGDLVFSLPGDWKATTQSEVDIASDGTIPDMGGVSGFIQGTNHRDMMPKPITFQVTAAAPTTFRARIAVAAKGGARAVLLLDGNQAASFDYPASGADQNVTDTLTAQLSAGRHTLTLANNGFDWYQVSTITLTHFAPSTPYAVQAKGNDHFALFWTYLPGGSRPVASHARAESAETDWDSLTLSMPNLKDGRYDMHFWSTMDGRAIGGTQPVRFTGGQALISLPDVDPDLAGWITPQSR